MFYSPANQWKVAARINPWTKYGLSATSTSPAWPYPDPPPHPPLEPHYVIPLSHLHNPLYADMTDPPLWWDMAGSGGVGVPSAPVKSVQFNNNGVFGGDANLTWNGSALLIGGTVQSLNGPGSTFSIGTNNWFSGSISTNGDINASSGNGNFAHINVSSDSQFGGAVLLAQDPVTVLEAATKQYVDAAKLNAVHFQVYNNASPQDGDLWYDGTHLNFRHGSTTTVIV